MSELLIPERLQRILTEGYDNIPLFAYFMLGMPMHPGQVKFLTDAKGKINILVPANRWGKSVTIGVKHIHHCFYKYGITRGSSGWKGLEYRTANISPKSANTEAVFKVIDQIMTSSFPIRSHDGSVVSNICQLEWFYDQTRVLRTAPYKNVFTNNSYTEHRSLGADQGDALQGKPYGYISYDEGGRSNHLEDELNDNIMPRLFDWNGSFDLVSTPDRKSPSLMYHHELFMLGLDPEETSYYTQEGSIDDNIFFSPAQIKQHKKDQEHNPAREQVLYGKFVFAGDAIYPADQIEDAKWKPLDDGVRHQSGHSYVIAIDTSIGEDEFVIGVLDITSKPFTLVRLSAAKGATRSPQQHMHVFMDIYEHYNHEGKVKVILETFNGESARFYMDMPRNIQLRTKCYGTWLPEGEKKREKGGVVYYKADLIVALQKIMYGRDIKIPADQKLVSQLIQYREEDKNLKQDRVIMLMLAAWYATVGRPVIVTPVFQKSNW